MSESNHPEHDPIARSHPKSISNDGTDAKSIIMIGTFFVLFVAFLIIAVAAYFHHYRHELQRERMASVGNWAAQIEARQLADLQPHWTGYSHKKATVGVALAMDMELAEYNPSMPPVLLAAKPQKMETGAPAPKVALHILGAKLYVSMGCNACHTVNGNPLVGPTWKNLAGYPQALTNGKTVVADYKFLRYMILHPDKLVVKGVPPIMPAIYTAQLSGPNHPHETKLNAIIWYINTLSNKSSKATQPPVPDGPAK